MVDESALALKNLWVAVRVENKYLRRYPTPLPKRKRGEQYALLAVKTFAQPLELQTQ
jgi:hypothetical protein